MTTFVLIPGAGGAAWYWHRLLPLLEQAGHKALAVDLPGDDPHAGLHAYADRVIASIGKSNDVTLVDDRFFPGDFQARLARERLGKSTDEVPGGHLVALSRPQELAKLLIAYATQ